jgi:hypothetical protein
MVQNMETASPPKDLVEQQQLNELANRREALIRAEWGIIRELQRMLQLPDLTISEKAHVANVFAYHANTLNKLLSQKGDKAEFSDQNLGEYLKGIEPKVARRFRRDFHTWKRTLSFRR